MLSPEESKYGAVETRVESRKCADLFRANRDRIDGVIVTLPNFGEERAIADTLRLAGSERARADSGHAGFRRRRCPSSSAATASAARCRPAIT